MLRVCVCVFPELHYVVIDNSLHVRISDVGQLQCGYSFLQWDSCLSPLLWLTSFVHCIMGFKSFSWKWFGFMYGTILSCCSRKHLFEIPSPSRVVYPCDSTGIHFKLKTNLQWILRLAFILISLMMRYRSFSRLFWYLTSHFDQHQILYDC
jgi:hypothetical protein